MKSFIKFVIVVLSCMMLFIHSIEPVEARSNTINEYRKAHKIKTVKNDKVLEKYAKQKFYELQDGCRWTHYTETTVYTVKKKTKRKHVGEVLAMGINTMPDTIDAWHNSPTHKAVLLDKKYKRVGIYSGISKCGDTTYTVAIFSS